MNFLKDFNDSKRWIWPFIVLAIIACIAQYMPGVLLGFIGAYTVASLREIIRDYGIKNKYAVDIVTVLVILGIATLFMLIIPLLSYDMTLLVTRLPKVLYNITKNFWESNQNIDMESREIYRKLYESIKTNAGSISSISLAKKAFTAVFRKLSMVIFSTFSILYNISTFCVSISLFLCNWEACQSFIVSCLPVRHRTFLVEKQQEFNDLCKIFFINQGKNSFANACLFVSLISIIGFPYPLPVFSIVFFGSCLPYLGCIIGYVFVISVALLEGYSWQVISSLSLVSAVAYFFENYLFVPVFLGQSIGIHPLVIMSTFPVFVKLIGWWGALFVIPIIIYMKIGIQYLFEKYAIYSIEKKYREGR